MQPYTLKNKSPNTHTHTLRPNPNARANCSSQLASAIQSFADALQKVLYRFHTPGVRMIAKSRQPLSHSHDAAPHSFKGALVPDSWLAWRRGSCRSHHTHSLQMLLTQKWKPSGLVDHDRALSAEG